MNKKFLKSIAYSGLVLTLLASSVCAMNKKNPEDIPSIPNKQINVPKLKKPTLEERIKICQEKVGNMVHHCNTVCEIIDNEKNPTFRKDCVRSCDTMNKNWDVCHSWIK